MHRALEHEEQARAALAQLEVGAPDHPAVLDGDGFRKRRAAGVVGRGVPRVDVWREGVRRPGGRG